MKDVKRGQLWYCDFGEAQGSEQGGVRPCVIVQNDKGNKFSPTTIVCPITSQYKIKMPTHFEIHSLGKPSVGIAEQIRTIDKTRLMDCVGEITVEELLVMNRAVKISLGV